MKQGAPFVAGGPAVGRRTGVDVLRGVTAAMAVLLVTMVWGMVLLALQLQRSESERAAQRQADAMAGLAAAQVAARLERLESFGRLLLATEAVRGGAPAPEPPAEVVAIERGAAAAEAAIRTPTAEGGHAVVVRGHGAAAEAADTVVMRVDMARLLSVARVALSGVDGVAVLVDASGRVLASGPSAGTLKAGVMLPPSLLAKARGAIDEVSTMQFGPDDVERNWALVRVARHDMLVGVGVSLAEARADGRKRAGMLALAALLETVVAITLAAIAMRQARRLTVLLRKLDLSRLRLRTANQAKSRFLQSISHELRTPLNGILPSSELMIQLVRTDEQAEIADMINQSAAELATMIDTLIDIADLQAGRAALQRRDVDIRRLIDAATLASTTAVRARGGRVTTVVAGTVPERLGCDDVRLGRVLRALVDAVSRLFEQPALRIEASMTAGPRLRLEVQCEAASGIPAEKASARGPAAAPDRARQRDAAAALGLLLIEDLLEVLGGQLVVLAARPGHLRVEVLIPVDPSAPSNCAPAR